MPTRRRNKVPHHNEQRNDRQHHQHQHQKQHPEESPHSKPHSKTSSQSSEQKQNDEDHNEPFHLFEGDTDIIDTWFNDLDDADKVGCLQIEPDEISEVVASLGLLTNDDHSAITPQLIDTFLSNAEVISALRLAFVNALYNQGLFDPTAVRTAARSQGILDVYSELLIQCALSTLESHLIEVRRRKRAVVRLLVFASFFMFRVAVFSRWLRWPVGLLTLLALHVATTQTGASRDESEMANNSEEYVALHAQYKALIRRYQSHLQLLLVPFEPISRVSNIAFDRASSPINTKIDALCAALCTATWVADHFTMNLVSWICLVCLATLPFILTTIQQHQAKATVGQQVAHYVRVIVAGLSELIVVYYAFKHSYVDFLFALVFFLPSVTSFAMSGIGLGLATAATVFIGMQRALFEYTRHTAIYCIIWICAVCNHLFMGYVQTSTLLWLVNWLLMLLLAPPQLVGGLCVLATVSTTALLSVGLNHLFALVFEVGLLAVISGLIVVFHLGKPFAMRISLPLIKRCLTQGVPGTLLRKLVMYLRRCRTALDQIRRLRKAGRSDIS